ncbi:hypothetical protein PVL29_021507 [Vitis rotundifolia]|uniref:Late embryogenesis abundant protein LEA-2 subgroup domain-containing protein n=1 Tax=Vitis rotundifolia TaxID=103349 RepID=A0AA38YZZ3_VITRO|nr:hypothetical protein PVL29_021507 [Vitis rotundifolia]
MAEKDQQVFPMEPTNAQVNTDEESARVHSEVLRHKKRMRRLGCVAAFTVLLTAIILAFALTVMHIKNPKFLFRSIEIEDLSIRSSTTTPSFSMRFDAELTVKNQNFGPFKYDKTAIPMSYGGTKVGEAFISNGEAKARSTKVIKVTVDVTSNNVSSNSNLASDINSGFLTLTGKGKLNGKVHLMKVFKKKKSPQMNCTIKINLENKVIQEWKCN